MFRYLLCRGLFIIFLVVPYLVVASSTQPICLNMIVKNESAVIKRCLASVKPLIDYWVIVDTGSTDGTQEIIKEYMKDIPGELHERPWKNFGYNRNEALQLAEGKGVYYLFMDADDWLEYPEGYSWPELTHDMYGLWRRGEDFSFINTHLIRSGLPWKWIGVVHEYIHLDVPFSNSLLEGVWYHVGNDGSSHQDPKKFLKYIALLEEALREEPDNMRNLISLAKSCKGADQIERALSIYERIVETCPWKEEVFWALIEIGTIKLESKRSPLEAISAYYRAHRLFPCRPEPIYFLSDLYNHLGRFDLAYACIKSRETLPHPHQRGTLFNLDWMEEYGVSFQLSISSFYLGFYQESLELCDKLLALKTLSEEVRKMTENNRRQIVQMYSS